MEDNFKSQMLEILEKSKQLDKQKDELIQQLTKEISQKTILIKEQKTEIQEQKEMIDRIYQSGELLNMKQVAKILNYKHNGKILGRNKIFEILRELEILMEGTYGDHNQPYQHYVNMEYFELRLKPREYNDNIDTVTLVTAKGFEFIIKTLDEYFKEEGKNNNE